MQHHDIQNDEPWGLPLSEKILPQYLKEAGYSTNLIGKWHLGFHKKKFTPTKRGFDSFFGFYGSHIGYYDYSMKMKNKNYSRGYDLRRNSKVAKFEGQKKYLTELFTEEAVKIIENHNESIPMFLMLNHLAPHAPLEAPKEEIEKFHFIHDSKRRTLAAMISMLDKSVGNVVEAINNKGIMNNSIILFMSSNGGPTKGTYSTSASNYPLRGQKGGLWEGGSRSNAFIYSPLIKNSSRIINDFIHITDILPTLLSLVNITESSNINDEIDGIDQWNTISEGEASTRKEILYNYENIRGYSAFMLRGWKIINGTDNIEYAGWIGESGSINNNVTHEEYYDTVVQSKVGRMIGMLSTDAVRILRNASRVECGTEEHHSPCNPIKRPCLFNILDDPCEKNNIAKHKPEIVRLLLSQLSEHVLLTVPSLRQPSDLRSDPKFFNNTWSSWLDDDITDEDEFPTIVIAILIFLPILFVFLARTRQKSRNARFQSQPRI
jgi:arylsulfatase B